MEAIEKQDMINEMLAYKEAVRKQMGPQGMKGVGDAHRGYWIGVESSVSEAKHFAALGIDAVVDKITRQIAIDRRIMAEVYPPPDPHLGSSRLRGQIYGATQVLEIAEKYAERESA